MQLHLTSELAIETLRHRQPPKNLIHHSDRGSQFASHAYQGLIKDHAIAPGMSGTSSCYDNAPMESFFATLKLELVHRRTYATRTEAKLDTFEYIEVFCNRTRRHSALRYLSPVDFELAPVVS